MFFLYKSIIKWFIYFYLYKISNEVIYEVISVFLLILKMIKDILAFIK
jgi:hypothetical protein